MKQGRSVSSAMNHDPNRRIVSGRTISGARVASGNRHVSRGDMFVSADDDSLAEDAIHFHENRNTIMSNFEEWIKLSTDNKITTKNSWQFALIDYFYDLNVIKDGNNINFQRASATLDGCVKIYSSRVESVASETGKLLSGLAKKKARNSENGEEDDENDDEDDQDENPENPTATRKERRINRVVESTLVDFETIKVKKLDQELAIDPLFKKALSDFDEGGAKSLLLNTLNIDKAGRVVFDATTNAPRENAQVEEAAEDDMDVDSKSNLDISKLGNILFKDDPSSLDNLGLCPTITELHDVLDNMDKAKSVLGNLNTKLLGDADEPIATQEMQDVPEQIEYGDFDLDLQNDNEKQDGPVANLDFDAIEADLQKERELLGHHEPGGVVATQSVMDQDLMAYFDETMKPNWRGPEHWKITALKQSKNFAATNKSRGASPHPEDDQAPTKRKRKEPVIIDFFKEEDEDYVEDIFQKAKKPSQISIAPEDRDSDNQHLLPDDIQFNSKRLVTLFVKPNRSIVTFTRKSKVPEDENGKTYTDQAYFADRYQEQEREKAEESRQERLAASFQQAELEDYDDFGDIDFNDVLGSGDKAAAEDEGKPNAESQFVTEGRRARPEYVNFSRVAKRVDVKLLKDNLWKSIKQEPSMQDSASSGTAESASPTEDKQKSPTPEIKTEKTFTEVVKTMGSMYRPEEKKDLSTSFCFICLLHLANEHGLSIESDENYEDLRIARF